MTESTATPTHLEKSSVNISGDYLSVERSTHTLKTSNVDVVEKSGGNYEEEDDQLLGIHVHGLGPGTAPEHVYEANMAWWRAGIRRFLVRNLHAESRWIAAMQVSPSPNALFFDFQDRSQIRISLSSLIVFTFRVHLSAYLLAPRYLTFMRTNADTFSLSLS